MRSFVCGSEVIDPFAPALFLVGKRASEVML